MCDDFIDNAVCQCMETGDLTAGATDPQSFYGDGRGVDCFFYLVEQRAIAFPGGSHRIAVSAKING